MAFRRTTSTAVGCPCCDDTVPCADCEWPAALRIAVVHDSPEIPGSPFELVLPFHSSTASECTYLLAAQLIGEACGANWYAGAIIVLKNPYAVGTSAIKNASVGFGYRYPHTPSNPISPCTGAYFGLPIVEYEEECHRPITGSASAVSTWCNTLLIPCFVIDPFNVDIEITEV